MKKIFLALSLLVSLSLFSQGVKYYPATSTKFGLVVQEPKDFNPNQKYMVMLIGHGAGEVGNGSQAALEKVYNWGAWASIKQAIDKYKFIGVFLNTAARYDKGEYQYALDWTLKNLPVDTNQIWVFGHSLGWFGAGRYAFVDAAFAKKIRGTFASSSGPYGTSPYKNLVDNDILVWGSTAANDYVMGTDPVWTTNLYDKMKALNPNAHVIVNEFPATMWPSDKVVNGHAGSVNAHNYPILKFTALSPVSLTPEIIRDRILSTVSKMNIFEWALSNPRGSIYQAPDHAYTGPKFPEEQKPPVIEQPAPPTPKPSKPHTFVGYNIYGENIRIEPVFADGVLPVIKGATGDEFKIVWLPAGALQMPTTTAKKGVSKMQVVK